MEAQGKGTNTGNIDIQDSTEFQTKTASYVGPLQHV